ncbi:MAG: thioredoxin-like domain-containing protein [Pseudomonadota bacterium]
MTWLVVANVVLWLLVIGLTIVVYALARQIGVLHERIAPAGALMLNAQLKQDDPAPSVAALDLDEVPHTVGGPSTTGRGTLLFFLAPDCPICSSLLPVVRSLAAQHEDVEVILASDGETLDDHRAYVAKNELTRFTYLLSEPLGKTYGVSKLPYAVLIRPAGTIASLGIVNSREHLESLFEVDRLGVASLQEYLGNGDG